MSTKRVLGRLKHYGKKVDKYLIDVWVELTNVPELALNKRIMVSWKRGKKTGESGVILLKNNQVIPQ